ILDLDHGNVLTAPDDHVLGPPGDGQVAVAVEGGAVARLEPAVGRVTVRGEFRPLEISGELRGTPNEEVAFAAAGDPAPVVVHHAKLHTWKRHAVGGKDLLLRVVEAVACDEPIFRHPPSGGDDAREPIARVLHELA